MIDDGVKNYKDETIEQCRLINGYLLSINSQEESDDVKQLIGGVCRRPPCTYHLDINNTNILLSQG